MLGRFTRMTFTPIFAHGGGLIPLAGGVMITAALVVSGLAIALTSKTSARWLVGAGLCLSGVVFLIVLFACFGSIVRSFGLE